MYVTHQNMPESLLLQRSPKLMVPRMRWHIGLFLSLFGLLFACSEAEETQRSRLYSNTDSVSLPGEHNNLAGVIVITVDTLRADVLGAYGHPRIQTPNLIELAEHGVLFQQAIAPSTTTTPSHASLFTGLYLQDHNVYSNFEALGNEPETMAEMLFGRGFATSAIVNMKHLNPEISNLGQGFQHIVRSGFMRKAGPSLDQLVRWLDHIGDQRFFSWVHLADVHTPYQPPPPYDRFYYHGDEKNPELTSLEDIWNFLPSHMSDHPFFLSWLRGIRDLDWVIGQYHGAVTYVDDEIGRLMDALEERELLNKTAIIVTSDHGESLGEHDLYFVHAGLYECTVRIPLIMYFPNSKHNGVVVHDVVETVDILPTLLEYLDLPIPETIRGRSLWPLIAGEEQPPRTAFIEHAGRNLVALRTDQYKYIQHKRTRHLLPAYPFVKGREELYDLQKDPTELKNIAQEQPEIIKEFRDELKRRTAKKLEYKTGEAKITPEMLDVLQALGYIQ